jgi:hypothetical protein
MVTTEEKSPKENGFYSMQKMEVATMTVNKWWTFLNKNS